MDTNNAGATPAAEAVQTVARANVPPPRAPALRVSAMGRAMKWASEIVEVEGEHYLVRQPSVAAQRKIMGCMPEQSIKGKPGEDSATLEDGTLEVKARPEIMLDMKIERLIQCTHDLQGQRVFKDEDRAEIEKWPADDELLDKVNAAVDRLTAKANTSGNS